MSVDRARVVFKERVNKVAFIKAEKVSHKTRQDYHVGGASVCVCACVTRDASELAAHCPPQANSWQMFACKHALYGRHTGSQLMAGRLTSLVMQCVMLLEDIHTYLHACTHTYIHTQYTHTYTHIHHNFDRLGSSDPLLYS